ncbi:MAG: SpoIIIAH-like family protein [Firmicutes bacterium]|nr:SpoIIIAH-like family protein [Bacillota bacterium]
MRRKFHFDIKGFLNKKENLALLTMAVVLCAGLVLTNVKNQIPLHDGDVLVDSKAVTEETASEGLTEASTLEQKRANLDLERNQLIAAFDETIKNSASDAEKKNAIKQKEQLAGYMEQEVAVEGILSTKNLPDCLVIITDSTVTVTVDEQDLKQNMVTKICSVVMTETGRSADKIIIQSLY